MAMLRFNPTDVVQLLQDMVRVDTVTPTASGRADAELPLAEALLELARTWGLSAEFREVPGAAPNVLITHEVSPGAPWLLFDSHLDTVGVEGMTIDPFAADVHDGRLYGRGVCDTKGTGAAMLWALREVREARTATQNIALLLSVCEEHSQLGVRHFLTHDLPGLAWRPAAVIVGEPTSMQVVAANNGFVKWKIRTTGVAVHSSTPHLGRNAVSDMARVIVALEDEYIARIERAHPLTGGGSCSINRISGGTQVNVVPAHCVIDVNRRLAPGESAEIELAQVEAILQTLRERDQLLCVQQGEADAVVPLAADVNLPFGERCAATLSMAGIPSQVTGAPYTTNGNHFGAAGLVTVVLGPGDIAQAHTKAEWLEVAELTRGVAGYRTLMEHGPSQPAPLSAANQAR
jgi:acetylornithine deacetylase